MFDSLWSSWLPTIRPVLSRILRGKPSSWLVRSADRKKSFLLIAGPHDHDLELPQIGDTDPTGLAAEPRNSSSLARLPKVEMAGAPDVLSSLLHITSKTLQFRERSNLQVPLHFHRTCRPVSLATYFICLVGIKCIQFAKK